jgi:hypothetical protein
MVHRKEALGFAIGDVIRTSYGTGPYVISSIWGPYWWWMPFNGAHYHVTIWPYPVISLVSGRSGINNIHQEGNRWFTDTGDEIFLIEKNKLTYQTSFLDNPRSIDDDARMRPYTFDPEVDYSDSRKVFKCWNCLRDFNGEKWNGGYANPHCPYCSAWVACSVIVMERVIPGNQYISACVRALNS